MSERPDIVETPVARSAMSRLSGGLAPVAGKPALDAATAHSVRVFVRRLNGKYTVLETILFGSRARQTHCAESDADLAVVLEGSRGDRYAAAGDMARIAFDVMMETGILVEVLPLWVDEFARPETFGNPALIHVIRREGLRS